MDIENLRKEVSILWQKAEIAYNAKKNLGLFESETEILHKIEKNLLDKLTANSELKSEGAWSIYAINKGLFEHETFRIFFLNILMLSYCDKEDVELQDEQTILKLYESTRTIVNLLPSVAYLMEKISSENKIIPKPSGANYILINNFLNIKTVSLSLYNAPSFVVFIGENSNGKTLLLRAVCWALTPESSWEAGDVYYDSYFESFKTVLLGTYSENKTLKRNLMVSSAPQYVYRYSYEDKDKRNVIAYGASRLSIQTPESIDAGAKHNSVYSLFNTEVSLLNIEYWLKQRLLVQEAEKVEKVLQLLQKLLPQIDTIRHRTETKPNKSKELIFEYIEDGRATLLRDLSAGQKSIVAFIGDMLIRLWDTQPDIENPHDLIGIVLIDELEAHLHPKWQRAFPKLLHETFPNVQFIVSTHSPIPLLGMPKDTALFHVFKDKEQGIQAERVMLDIENMQPNQLLTSPLFGMDGLRSLYNENVQDFHTEDDYKERLRKEENQQWLKQLAEKLKNKGGNDAKD